MIHTISLIAPRGNILSVKAAGSGPTLMLLHGFPLDHRMWHHQVEGLADQYHVIVPEFRGFGQSTLSEPAFTLKELADDVEFLRGHLAGDQPIRLCGLSMGGYVALEYWQHHRQHLECLILANTKPTADDETAQSGRLKMADQALREGSWRAVEGMLTKLLSAATLQQQTNVRSLVEEMMRSASAAGVAAAQRAMASRRDFTSVLPSIATRTLVITGADDPIAPPDVTEQWAKTIPHVRYECIAGAGHLTPLEQPDVFNELLRGAN